MVFHRIKHVYFSRYLFSTLHIFTKNLPGSTNFGKCRMHIAQGDTNRRSYTVKQIHMESCMLRKQFSYTVTLIKKKESSLFLFPQPEMKKFPNKQFFPQRDGRWKFVLSLHFPLLNRCWYIVAKLTFNCSN